MKYKSILALSLAAMLSFGALMSGCGNKNAANNGNTNGNTATDGNNIANNATDNGNGVLDNGNTATDKAGDAVRNGADAVKNGVESVGDSIKYTAIDFKDYFTNAGRDIKESADTKKDYFTVNEAATETDYLIDGELVRVYEFNNSEDADKAVSQISSDGLSINNSSVYTTKPTYYRKGNTIVIYEGTNDQYMNEFNSLYGSPIV